MDGRRKAKKVTLKVKKVILKVKEVTLKTKEVTVKLKKFRGLAPLPPSLILHLKTRQSRLKKMKMNPTQLSKRSLKATIGTAGC